MTFAVIARHRDVWPLAWMGSALNVPRLGFRAWLASSPCRRARNDEALLVKVRTSFAGSDRTHGAWRVWRDVLAEGVSCGRQAISARPEVP